MYLVELASGKQAVYRSVDEFTAAIRRSEVSSQSRIYHRASSTWIPVTLHPQFRKVAAEWAAEPPRPLLRTQWTFYRGDTAERAPTPREAAGEQASADAIATRTMPARSWRSMLGGLIGHHQG
jgi:hypothetical protein